MRATIIIAAFAAAFSAAPALAATNLVVNGGFETGDFSGWQQTGDMTYSGVYDSAQTGGMLPVDDGKYSAGFGPTNLGGITQMIQTVPGRNYTVSFDLANTDTSATNHIYFSFDDGYQIFDDTLAASGFQTYVIPVTASGLNADVSFLFSNPNGYFLLDDVAVVGAVPEPASWAMLLTGFVAIGATLRRRRLVAA